jgi:hypothetical protein
MRLFDHAGWPHSRNPGGMENAIKGAEVMRLQPRPFGGLLYIVQRGLHTLVPGSSQACCGLCQPRAIPATGYQLGAASRQVDCRSCRPRPDAAPVIKMPRPWRAFAGKCGHGRMARRAPLSSMLRVAWSLSAMHFCRHESPRAAPCPAVHDPRPEIQSRPCRQYGRGGVAALHRS